MQIPKRRSQLLRKYDDEGEILLTPEGLKKLKSTLERLDRVERPRAVKDVSVAVEKGDLSENAEYQEARPRLSRIEHRILTIKDQLKRVSVIHESQTGIVALGSTVTLQSGKTKKSYRIVGPHEADVRRGRISHVSPLGAALMNHKVGDVVQLTTERGEAVYRILEVR